MRIFFALLATASLALAGATSSNAQATVDLSWTAPGDDSLSGRAVAYDLRISFSPISVLNFTSALRVPGTPVPAAPGSRETMTVSGLTSGTTYHFALKTVDEVGNWSGISNLASRVAAGTVAVPAGPPLELRFSAPFPNPARSHASFAMSLPEPSEIEITVFDLQGRRVRGLADGPRPAGATTVGWNLRDNSGMRVAPGTYLVRARIGSTQMVRRVVVVG